MSDVKGPGRPKKAEAEKRKPLPCVTFKVDEETEAALGRLVARMKPVGGSASSKSTVLRRLILDADRDLETFARHVEASAEDAAKPAVVRPRRAKKPEADKA